MNAGYVLALEGGYWHSKGGGGTGFEGSVLSVECGYCHLRMGTGNRE